MAEIRIGDQSYGFELDKLTNVEIMAIEKETGLTFPRWGDALREGSITAITGLVYVLRKRAEPTLKFADVVFPLDSIELVDDEDDGEAVEDAGKEPSSGSESP